MGSNPTADSRIRRKHTGQDEVAGAAREALQPPAGELPHRDPSLPPLQRGRRTFPRKTGTTTEPRTNLPVGKAKPAPAAGTKPADADSGHARHLHRDGAGQGRTPFSQESAMHYRNGREAKNGDKIIQMDP